LPLNPALQRGFLFLVVSRHPIEARLTWGYMWGYKDCKRPVLGVHFPNGDISC
jgi:hypothetical protein